MIKHLYIQNYALIRQLDTTFSSGLTVITGETGAGKSILLGAIGLLAGNRADHSVLLNQDQKCVIEGTFILDKDPYIDFFQQADIDFDGSIIIRREINPGGKTRSFINDTPVSLQTLKELGDRILNIHSQHETLLLSERGFQLEVLDAWSGNQKEKEQYVQLYKQFIQQTTLISELKTLYEKQSSEADYRQFLFDELIQAQISEDEEPSLVKEQQLLENAGKISENLYACLQMLTDAEENIVQSLKKVAGLIDQLRDYLPEAADWLLRLQSATIETADISNSINSIHNKIEHDPARLEMIHNRLDEYNRLLHKHRVSSVSELMQTQHELERNLHQTSDLQQRITEEDSKLSMLKKSLTQQATLLSEKRRKAATGFSHHILELIQNLGMPNASFEVTVSDTDEFKADGKNQVQFLFNANKGGKLQDLGHVVSGGELSRVMLAIKAMTAARNVLPTVIFDEIDSGVSGETAAKMGNILKKMSAHHQIIAITHLPQIAARGEEHIHVTKNEAKSETTTVLEKISDAARVEIIARMISDENMSASALTMARELLSN